MRKLIVPLLATWLAVSGPAHADPGKALPRLGIIAITAATDRPNESRRLDLIRKALASQGWIDGQTIMLEVRAAKGDPERFRPFAEELIRLGVDLIWADSAPALRATYAATRTIPIVAYDWTSDPVAGGYASTLARPGGNVTGLFLDAPQFSGKWLELLRAVVPGLARVAVMWDPVAGETHVKALQAIAPAFGVRLQIVEVHRPEDIDAAEAVLRGGAQALITLPSPMMFAETARVARLALKLKLPSTSIFPTYAHQGGAIAYGPDQERAIERAAMVVTRILRGAKPGELPIERPTKFDLVLNLKTFKALKLTVPDAVLARADEVIR